jgi:hypothetical protein
MNPENEADIMKIKINAPTIFFQSLNIFLNEAKNLYSFAFRSARKKNPNPVAMKIAIINPAPNMNNGSAMILIIPPGL